MLSFLAIGSLPSAAYAAEGAIDHVEVDDDGVRILYSVPGLGEGVEPDLSTVAASIEGKSVEATAVLAAKSGESVKRTTILAIDVSNSMRGEKFEEAKRAAAVFLETVPADVRVGIVTFAQSVTVVQEPDLDRASAVALLDDLDLSAQTSLYEGIQQAVRSSGAEGQRNVIVLSDGADTSDLPLGDVTGMIEDSEVRVDVVALAQSAAARQSLERIASVGGGRVLDADEPGALSAAFASQAQALARQVVVNLTVPADLEATEGTVSVSLEADGATYTDNAFVTVQAPQQGPDLSSAPLEGVTNQFTVSQDVMLAGLAAAAVGGLVVLLTGLGVLGSGKGDSVEERIAVYGQAANASSAVRGSRAASSARPDGVAGSARAMAEKALSTNKGREAALGRRLEAAGMSVKPAEWVLIHVGIAFGPAVVGMLLGSVVLALVLVFLGIVGPHLYLKIRTGRRLKSFNGQLADTLQLMAGSLSAGLSFAQSVDTVVREGAEPVTTEFKRALVEARLGVAIEDALDSVAERMQSADFKWVVMAVRIQREVGGNLSEVLKQVAATIRERAYLQRQVRSLSAEGRLSAWILGALPPVMFVYFLAVRPEYMDPLFEYGMGWAMLFGGVVLMGVGVFWMTRLVKMEV